MRDGLEISRESAETLLRVCLRLPGIESSADRIAVGKAQQELESMLRKGSSPTVFPEEEGVGFGDNET